MVTPYGSGRAWVGPSSARRGLLGRLSNLVRNVLHNLRLLSLMGAARYDAVIVRDKIGAALIALASARMYGTKCVFWMSYPTPEAALTAAREHVGRLAWLAWLRGHLARLALYTLVVPWADHVLVQSERMKQDLEAVGVAGAKMTPVPMGVRLGLLTLPYPVIRVHKPARERWVVYLGTLARVRRLDILVGAFALVRPRVPDAKLYLVGAGNNSNDERELRRVAAEAGVGDHVIITGQLDRDLAWEYVAAADVCVSPFRDIPILQSTSPTKLIEYMALERPVVASIHPEQDRILGDSRAGVSAPYTEASFSKAIVQILEDPQAARAMGQRGRVWVERNRGYDAIAALVEQGLRRVLEAG